MRIWNSKENAHNEAIEGLLFACKGKYKRLHTKYGYGLYKAKMPENQVRIIINGGGGFGPMWLGFANDGLADAMVHGDFSSAPNAYVLYEMAKQIDCGNGILFLTNNFMGDYLNNDLAIELLERDGIKAKAIYVSDDMMSCHGEEKSKRGGLHGIGQICKIAAEAAQRKKSLDKIYELAQKANDRIRSLSINIRNGKAFWGEGFSGEPAVYETEYSSLDHVAEKAMDLIWKELSVYKDNTIYISVNKHCEVGFVEGLVILNAVKKAAEKQQINVCEGAVGTYFDVFEGKGCMISVMLCDEELMDYIHPATGYSFTI